MQVFHPGVGGSAGGTVVWAGTSGGRDDAALVLVDESLHWRPPATPVLWGRPDTKRPGTPCETWGVPDEAQRRGRPVEASQLVGEVNPGSGFVGNQYVVDLRSPVTGWPGDGTSPWSGLSGAAVFCDRYLTGVVASDRQHSDHRRLNVVPSYVLHHDPAFRATLADHGGSAQGGLEAVEFQDLAEPSARPAARLAPVTPAALLEAGRQTVPFQGRQDLVAQLEAWCGQGGFGAWLLHGPGGQGKTRLAHHLAHLLTARGWTVLWPRVGALPDQLLEVRRAAKPLLVILDYAETRPEQLTALVEGAAEHPGTSPFKLLLLARTAGDWWQQAATTTRQAEDRLTTARTSLLTPLEGRPDGRADHYLDAARALATALPAVPGLSGHDWTAAATALQPPRHLGEDDAYGNALTLHMTALADLLDTTRTEPADSTAGEEDVQDVEDRLLGHEVRYWRASATARGLSPGLGMDTLRTALAAAHLTGAADREHADLLWRRLPALADQPRDRRNQVTAWLAALYPAATSRNGPPWGALQPDRLAERHTGRTLDSDPHLADHLLAGADDTQAEQLLTVYSRCAAHPAFRGRLDNHLTDLCIRHHPQLIPHIVTTATRTDHPTPFTTALDTIISDPAASLDDLDALHSRFPHTSHRLATTAARLATAITRHYRALAEANPDAHLPRLAMALNNLSVRLGEVGRREEGLGAAQESVTLRRALAEANPDAHLPDLATALNNLSVDLGELGRREEGLTTIQEAVGHYRALAEANPDAHLPDLASALNNLAVDLGGMGRREEGLTTIQEAVGHYRALAKANPDAHLPRLAMALNNLSNHLGEVGRREEGLGAAQESVTLRRALAEANPDAHLPDLASSLNNLSVDLGEMGRREEGLGAAQESVTLRRALAEANPDAHLPDLAMALTNLSNRLGEVGRREEGLTTIQEAVGHYRALAEANPDAHLPNLAMALNNLSVRLGEVGRREEGLAAAQESVILRRALAEANIDAHLPNLAMALNNLSNRLRKGGRREEGLTTIQEAVGHYRALAKANPDAHLPRLAMALDNLSNHLGEAGRREEGLTTIQETVAIRRTLAEANPDLFEPALQRSLNTTAWLEGLES
ncbi:tetratricopeptide repeat protein [Streptomyces sp. Sge12]|uniref:tetratricopeptide repeat protein n=1 Tax=Streptomyces sp. Sge12 TaxID=1972846 RepID=UPI001F357A7B|nr:tetratricopeptide repeat protein [Streptomyces sp. Sge12]